MKFSFLFSCTYLIWGLVMQAWVFNLSKTVLIEQGINTDKVLVSATPLNTLLWRIVAIDGAHYYQGLYSVFDQSGTLFFSKHERNLNLITQDNEIPALVRFNWFTSDFYALEKQQDLVIATDLRMGIEPNYFFKFKMASTSSGQTIAIEPNQLHQQRHIKESLMWTWQRIWSPNG